MTSINPSRGRVILHVWQDAENIYDDERALTEGCSDEYRDDLLEALERAQESVGARAYLRGGYEGEYLVVMGISEADR
jgi:hypothetical protein